MRHRAILTTIALAIAAPLAAQQPAAAAAPRLRAARAPRHRPPSDELLFIWTQMLAGQNEEDAAKAAESLAHAGARALPHLKPLLQSPDSVVRQRARDVIAAVQAPPARSAPAQPVPVKAAPAQPVPVKTAPARSGTAQSEPARPAPVMSAPVKAAPANAAPASAAPANPAPANPAPARATPDRAAPAATMPVKTAPAPSGAALAAATTDAQRDSLLETAARTSTGAASMVPAIVRLLPDYPPNVHGEPLRRRMLAVLIAAGPAAAPAVPTLAAALRRNDTLSTSALDEPAENWRLTFEVFAAVGPAARSAMPLMRAALDQNAAWSPADREAAYREGTAARALAAMGPDGVAALVDALHDGNGVRRRNAAYGLSYVHTAQAVTALAGAVRDTAHVAILSAGRPAAGSEGRWEQAWQLEAARVAAIDALGTLGPVASDALPVLEQVASHPSPSLGPGGLTAARAAGEAVAKIRMLGRRE